MTYLSRTLAVGDGTTTRFTVTFPYLAQADVTLYVNNVLQPFIWVNPTQIQVFGFTPPNGAAVEIRRTTTVDAALVTYGNATVLTKDQLNTATLQNLYISQELYDLYNEALGGSLAKVATGAGISVVDPSQIISQLAYDVLDSELLTQLNSRITDISANAESILGLTGDVNTLQDFQNLLGTVTDGVLTINTSTVQVSPGVSMASQISGIEANVAANTAGIATESTARADGDSALAAQISILVAGTATFYVQPTAPTSPNPGDVWYDSSDNNHPYKYDHTLGWVDVRDGAITEALADIATESSVRASGDAANAASITSLSSTVAGNTASLATQATSINGLEAEYTVKTNINGFVAGYGLASYLNTDGSHTSQFIVLADEFGVVFPQIPWHTGLTVTLGQYVIPSATSTGYIYRVTVAGAVGSTEPAWSTSLGATFTDGGVTYKVVSPTHAAPFVVGAINGTTGVGINGDLVIDGTLSAGAIVANSITTAQLAVGAVSAANIAVGTLDAISANMGTITAGTFKTAGGAATRLEISAAGAFPLWYGTGTKTAGNATMYVDTSGNLFVTGTITGSLFDQSSFRLNTGGNCRAPLIVMDSGTWAQAGVGNFNVTLGPFSNPSYNTGFDPSRIYANVQDFFFDVNVSTNGAAEKLSLQYKYAGQTTWTTIEDLSVAAGYSIPWKPRYTTKTGAWSYVQFRVISNNGTCYTAAVDCISYNILASSNAANSCNTNDGRSSTNWNPPSYPGTYVP